ncbi:MAG: DUF5060 domain-containing protein [Sedimentisphaerales bacterium]|nr:DUF5060 domain-containing protein [Sedimentisphaerales bacterium]
MSGRVHILMISCILVCAAGGAGAVGQPPIVPPPGQTQLNEAYYYSTIGQEMAQQAKLRQAEAAVPAKVGRWGRFETSLVNQGEYADPYTDVTLGVTCEGPDGESVEFRGFYDGNDTWRIRFMPDRVGTWRYEASFSDGSVGRKGTFECVPSEIPGMLSGYKPNPIWFAYAGEKPVVIRSFHVGDRFFADADNSVTGDTWSPARRKAFLDWAQAQGYNMLSVASCYLNRDSGGRGKGWNTPDLWDAKRQRPNPREYQRMERVLDDLSARRIVVYPFAGFFGRDSDFPKDKGQQDLYLRYTLARLGAYWNVLLMVGGPEPTLKGKPYLGEDEIHRIGRKVESLDIYGHLLSVHNPTGDDAFREAEWTSYGVLQGPKTVRRRKLSRGLLQNHHEARPLYAQETLWPGNIYHPRYDTDDIRKNAYVMMMSAAAVNFADMSGNSSSGFSGTLDLDRKIQQRHDVIKKVWDFFEKVPFHRMKPRQDLVDKGYCLADEGKEYLVYLERSHTVSVKIDGGPCKVTWINAQDTTDRRDDGSTESGQDLKPPAGADDWLLHLTHS